MWLYGDTECRLLQIIQMGHLACLAACHNKIETDFHHKQLSIQYEVLILTDYPNGTPGLLCLPHHKIEIDFQHKIEINQIQSTQLILSHRLSK